MTGDYPKFLKPSVQATQKDQEILEGRRIIYDAFLDALKAYRDWDQLKQGEKESFAFMLDHHKHKTIFSNADQEKIKELSEDNFYRFLLSVYKGVRAGDLANEKNLQNDEIQNQIHEIVNKCLEDVRGTEARDSITNFFKSFLPDLLWKVPGLGNILGEKGHEQEESLSAEKVVTKFLRKSLLPIVLFVLTLLIFGAGPIMTPIAVIGLLITVIGAIKGICDNRKGTLHDPKLSDHVQSFSSHDGPIVGKAANGEDQRKQAEDETKAKKWNKKFIDGINGVRSQIPVKEAEQPSTEQVAVLSTPIPVLKEVTVNQHGRSEDERREGQKRSKVVGQTLAR